LVTGATILAAGATIAAAATVLSAASLESVGLRWAVAVAMRVVAPVLMAPTKEDVASMFALEPVLAAVIMLAAATSLAAASATVSRATAGSRAPSVIGTSVVLGTGSGVPRAGICGSNGGDGGKTRPLTSVEVEAAVGAWGVVPAGSTRSA